MFSVCYQGANGDARFLTLLVHYENNNISELNGTITHILEATSHPGKNSSTISLKDVNHH